MLAVRAGKCKPGLNNSNIASFWFCLFNVSNLYLNKLNAPSFSRETEAEVFRYGFHYCKYPTTVSRTRDVFPSLYTIQFDSELKQTYFQLFLWENIKLNSSFYKIFIRVYCLFVVLSVDETNCNFSLVNLN